MFHFVWIPKYRHKVFVDPCHESMKAVIKKIGYDFDIQELEIPEDHIHMVIKGEPKTASSHVMQVIKSISAREFFKLYPEIRKRYFCGGKLWTQSYLVETIVNTNEETIRKYVQNQLIDLNSKLKNAEQLGLF